MSSTIRALTLGTLALTAAVPTRAQQPASKERAPLVVRIGTDLVQVDAVVVDKKGRHVTDLTADDFEILQGKKPRPVTHSKYVVADTVPRSSKGAAPKVWDPSLPPPKVEKLRPEDVRRAVAVIVDDLNMSHAGMHYTREALKRFVDHEVGPGDLVAIVRTQGGMGILQQFTTDRQVLKAAVDDLRYWIGSSIGINDDGPGWDGPSQWGSFRNLMYGSSTLGSINFVLDGLRELPGRKSVLLFSESLPIYDRTDSSFPLLAPEPGLLSVLQRVTDHANRASVVIYTVDPGGLRTVGFKASERGLGFNAADRGPGDDPGEWFRRTVSDRSIQLWENTDGLRRLAENTGGLFNQRNDVDGAVRAVMTDLQGYYVLGFVPDDKTFQRAKRGPVFHNIRVRVKRPGLSVRSRRGFVGVTDEDKVQSGPRTVEETLLKAAISPFTANDVPVRLTSLFGHDPRAGYVVRSFVHVDAERLAFRPAADGMQETELQLTTALVGENGETWVGTNHKIVHPVPAGALDHVRRAGLVLEVNATLEKPGPYQFRVALRDAVGERLGSATHFVHVPDLSKRRLALSGVVLGSSVSPPARDGEAPVVSTGLDVGASPAVRRFRPGAEVAYAFVVYHPEMRADAKLPELSTHLRLVRDGQEIVHVPLELAQAMEPLAPAGEKKKGVKDVRSFVVAGRFRLPAGITPGQYDVQMVVTDQLSKEKVRSARQWAGFEVVADTRTGTLTR